MHNITPYMEQTRKITSDLTNIDWAWFIREQFYFLICVCIHTHTHTHTHYSVTWNTYDSYTDCTHTHTHTYFLPLSYHCCYLCYISDIWRLHSCYMNNMSDLFLFFVAVPVYGLYVFIFKVSVYVIVGIFSWKISTKLWYKAETRDTVSIIILYR